MKAVPLALTQQPGHMLAVSARSEPDCRLPLMVEGRTRKPCAVRITAGPRPRMARTPTNEDCARREIGCLERANTPYTTA